MYQFEIVRDSELRDFNEFVKKSSNGNFRQTSYWGEIKALSGWEPMCFVLKEKGIIKGTALIQKRKMPFTPFSLMYCCRGPVIDWSDSACCKALFAGLSEVMKNNYCSCLRFDPESAEDIACLEDELKVNGLVKIKDRTSQWNRSLYSTRVMLGKDDSELFSQMKRTHRQNINKTIREGVTVNFDHLPSDKQAFFSLMQGLECRRNSLIHSRNYYDKIYDVIIENDIGIFVKAIFKEKIIASLIVVVLGDKAWALFMANDYEYRKLMPNKLLLWEAIKFANKQGCQFLDLGSTQGTEKFDPENDPLDFLKRAYKPEVKYYPGYFDMKGLMYHGFRFLETYAIPIVIALYYKLNRRLKIK